MIPKTASNPEPPMTQRAVLVPAASQQTKPHSEVTRTDALHMNVTPRLAFVLCSLHEHMIAYGVLCISCVAFIIFRARGLDAMTPWFLPATWPELLQPFSPWRLWTPMFVHYTLPHLLTNLYLWWLFATRVESASRLELIVLVAIAALVSNAMQWWLAGPNFGGLSGVVYALLSYRWVCARYGGMPHYRIEPLLGLLLLALIPLAASGLFGKFADFAHIGGLASGAILAMARLAKHARNKTGGPGN
jgi:membrane associated rhomboid family serine protease